MEDRGITQARQGTRTIVWRIALSTVTLSGDEGVDFTSLTLAGGVDQASDPAKSDPSDPFDFYQVNNFSADGQQAGAVQTPAANTHSALGRLFVNQPITEVMVARSDRTSKLRGRAIAADSSIALASARPCAVSGIRASHSFGTSRSIPPRAPMAMTRREASA